MYVHRMTDVLFHMLSNIVCLRGLADLRQSDKLILKKINQVSCCATDLVGLMFGDKRKWQEKIIVGVKMSFKVIDFPGSHDKCGQGTIIKTLIVDYLFTKTKNKRELKLQPLVLAYDVLWRSSSTTVILYQLVFISPNFLLCSSHLLLQPGMGFLT